MTDRSPAPRVSVVVPAFNAEDTLGAALRSVFAQDFSDFEVVVVDDGSTDRTAGVGAGWDDRLTLIRQPNRGPAAARNRGIEAARGEFIAFLDADDAWLPDKLGCQVAYFEKYPATGLLHTGVVVGSPGMAVTAPSAGSQAVEPPRRVFCELFHTTLDINTLTVMAPRAVLLRAGGFDERRTVHVEDWDLWLRVAETELVGYLPWPTAIRRPGGSMSSATEKTFLGQAMVIEKLAPACANACPNHRAGARACLARRWHRFYWELGYARLRDGRRAAACSAFARSIAHRPLAGSSYRQLARIVLGRRVENWGRRLRELIRPSAAPAKPDAPAPSLLHDTLYWRNRERLVRRLHAIDDAVYRARQGERLRVLFEAASPMSYEIFRSVHEQLQADPRFEFWFTATGDTWPPDALYARVGVTSNIVPAASASLMKVDVCINTDFSDTTWLHRRTKRLHLFHGVAGKYDLDAPIELAPTVRIFDRLMFPNADRMQRYIEAGLVAAEGPVPVLVGYPKLDRLVNGTLDADLTAARLGLDRERRTVLFAPTWSPYSSLNTMGEALIRELAGAGFNVLVKLHDRSYDLAARASGGVDWRARLSAFAANPLVRIVSDPDGTPCLAVADALVTDHSSIGFEFSLLDRPLVVVDCPALLQRARVTPSKVAALRAAAEVADSPAGVVAALSRQLEEPSLHSPQRQGLARQFFYRPGTATARAVAAVYDALGLQVPAYAAEAARGAVLASVGRG